MHFYLQSFPLWKETFFLRLSGKFAIKYKENYKKVRPLGDPYENSSPYCNPIQYKDITGELKFLKFSITVMHSSVQGKKKYPLYPNMKGNLLALHPSDPYDWI